MAKLLTIFILSMNILSSEKVVSRKVKSNKDYKLAVEIFSNLTKCNLKKSSINSFKLCISTELSVSLSKNMKSKIAQWIKANSDYSEAYVCKNEVLDLFYHSDNPDNEVVLCFNYAAFKKKKMGMIYFVKDRGNNLKIGGIQY
jgi:hypothetical protein